ncbi:MAG: DUF3592 domain-containing protein [Spirochaetales bacterium]|nr:DUF3592 domain-containing protein [Spirochaetales bacterium]
MTDIKEKKSIKTTVLGIIFIFLVFAIPGGLMTGAGVQMLVSRMTIEAWPRVPGAVLSLKMERGSEDSYCLSYVYTYEVDGNKLTNNVFSPSGDYCYGDEEMASHYFLKEGAAVTVYYNPENPAESYLFNDDFPTPYFIIPMGVGLLAIGIGVAISIFRKR